MAAFWITREIGTILLLSGIIIPVVLYVFAIKKYRLLEKQNKKKNNLSAILYHHHLRPAYTWLVQWWNIISLCSQYAIALFFQSIKFNSIHDVV